MVGDNGYSGQTRSVSRCISAKAAVAQCRAHLVRPADPHELGRGQPPPSFAVDGQQLSWGGGSGDPFFQPAVQALGLCAGNFPGVLERQTVGALGCGSAGSPGLMTFPRRTPPEPSTLPCASFSFPWARRPSAGSSSRTSRRRGEPSASLTTGATRLLVERHVDGFPTRAGTVALILSISPGLRNDVARTEAPSRRHRRDKHHLRRRRLRQRRGEGKLNALATVNRRPDGARTARRTVACSGLTAGNCPSIAGVGRCTSPAPASPVGMPPTRTACTRWSCRSYATT